MTLNIAEIVLLVLGLTQWVKTKLKLVDTVAEVTSFVIGFLLGGAYQFVVSQPVDARGWFLVLLVGIGMGLVPSGLYKFAGTLAVKFGNNGVK